ncbi:hypothetical protein [Endozoicomonas acroporae]|uniref:hypothetical protein n=1 Tax=Endozoicomonas acroporae TaxID=1701104 RepID=UPI0013D2BF6A|nr:hypothetical protein [Endozoicomonas acroporae]
MDNPELEGVEKPAIAWLVKLGYTHLSGAEVGRQQAHRHMAPILEDVLAEQLLRLNPWLATLQKESGNSPTATVLRELRKFWQENLLEANQNAWASSIHGSNIQLAYGTTTIEWIFQAEPGLKRHYITVERGRPVLLRGRAIPEAEQRQLIRQRTRWIRERLKQVNQPCKETFVTGTRALLILLMRRLD